MTQPPYQQHLFDRDAANAAKQAGIDQVEEHGDSWWKWQALRATYAVCRRRLRSGVMEFTTDATVALLMQWGVGDPREPRLWGPVMLTAAKRGWCTPAPTPPVASTDRTNHGRLKRVWRVCPNLPDWDGEP